MLQGYLDELAYIEETDSPTYSAFLPITPIKESDGCSGLLTGAPIRAPCFLLSVPCYQFLARQKDGERTSKSVIEQPLQPSKVVSLPYLLSQATAVVGVGGSATNNVPAT